MIDENRLLVDVLIVVPCKSEAVPLLKTFSGHRRINFGSFYGYKCMAKDKIILVVVSGVGENNISNLIRVSQNQFKCKCIVLFGFAGALSEHLNIGDIIIADKIFAVNREGFLSCDSERSMILFKKIAESVDNACFLENIVTSDHIVCQTREREELGSRYEAKAVEMEAYFLAQWANDQKITFLCIKVISDKPKRNDHINYCMIISQDGCAMNGNLLKFVFSHWTKASYYARDKMDQFCAKKVIKKISSWIINFTTECSLCE